MSELVSYGVECKNPDCGSVIVMGELHINPKRRGDLESVPKFMSGRLVCKNCGKEYEYTRADLRHIPLVEGESGVF
jgi:hypothetical protein